MVRALSWRAPLALLCIAALFWQLALAADEMYDRETLASLSKLHAETKGLGLAERCGYFEQKLRELSGEQVERAQLIGSTVSYLAARKLPFGNSQPVLELLRQCLEATGAAAAGPQQQHASGEQKREVIAGRPASSDAAADSAEAMRRAQQEFKQVRDNVKDFGQDLYGPGKQAGQPAAGGAREHGAMVSEFVDDELEEAAIERESDPIKRLAMQLERERRLVDSLRSELSISESEMSEMSARLRELEAQVQSAAGRVGGGGGGGDGSGACSEQELKLGQLSGLHEQALGEQAELRAKLEQAQRRILELEAARAHELAASKAGQQQEEEEEDEEEEDDDDEDDDESAKGLTKKERKKLAKKKVKLALAVQKLHEKFASREGLESRCQKYFMLYSYPKGKLTRELVKLLSRLQLAPSERGHFAPAGAFFEQLKQMSAELVGSAASARARNSLIELDQCQSLRRDEALKRAVDDVARQLAAAHYPQNHKQQLTPNQQQAQLNMELLMRNQPAQVQQLMGALAGSAAAAASARAPEQRKGFFGR